MSKKQRKSLLRISISALLLVAMSLLKTDGIIALICFLIPYLIVAYDILINAFRGMINRSPFDECFLMSVATIGAFCIGEYKEAVFVMLFYQLGELFQGYAVNNSRKSISSLMDIRPDYANIMDENGEFVKVDAYEISVGDYIYVRPGERIAFDGVVEEGDSTLDMSALTGESMPRNVKVSDNVQSGSVNLSGLLKIRVTKEFEESTASKILELVENATANKSASEKFISKFARIYTPIVCLGALLLAVVPPIIIWLCGGELYFTEWIYRALTFLVISCPCALVVSVPLSFFAGIGCASKNGILIKGANYLEALSKVVFAVFDKTGTLTEGVFKVSAVYPSGVRENELFEYAVLAECYSKHPISESLTKSYSKVLDKSRISCFTEMSGLGVSAVVDGKQVYAGNALLMEKYNIDYSVNEDIGTVVYVAVDNSFYGSIVISDMLKKNSADTLKKLKECGVKRTVMLTGDRNAIARRVSVLVKADEFHSELLPSDKLDFLESIISEKPKGRTVVFVGDGINDAPVIARADVGIAMGALGSDAAIEAADVVLMDDDPSKVAAAVRISKKCMSIVYQNIYFSIGVKLLVLLLGALGIVNMWFAVFADVGVMLIAVLNAIRAMKI